MRRYLTRQVSKRDDSDIMIIHLLPNPKTTGIPRCFPRRQDVIRANALPYSSATTRASQPECTGTYLIAVRNASTFTQEDCSKVGHLLQRLFGRHQADMVRKRCKRGFYTPFIKVPHMHSNPFKNFHENRVFLLRKSYIKKGSVREH